MTPMPKKKKPPTTAKRLAQIEEVLLQLADRMTALEDNARTGLDETDVETIVEDLLLRDQFRKRLDELFRDAGEVLKRQREQAEDPGPTTIGGSTDADL